MGGVDAKWFHSRLQSGSTQISVDFQRTLSSPAEGSDEEDDVASTVQVNVSDPSLANTDQLEVGFVNAPPGENPVRSSVTLHNDGSGHFTGAMADQLLRYRTADGYTSPSSTQIRDRSERAGRHAQRRPQHAHRRGERALALQALEDPVG